MGRVRTDWDLTPQRKKRAKSDEDIRDCRKSNRFFVGYQMCAALGCGHSERCERLASSNDPSG